MIGATHCRQLYNTCTQLQASSVMYIDCTIHNPPVDPVRTSWQGIMAICNIIWYSTIDRSSHSHWLNCGTDPESAKSKYRTVLCARLRLWLTCSPVPVWRDRLMYSMVLNCGAQSGHSRSLSPSDRRLNAWPHKKCTAGSSSGAPVKAHLLLWKIRACHQNARAPYLTMPCSRLSMRSNWFTSELKCCVGIWERFTDMLNCFWHDAEHGAQLSWSGPVYTQWWLMMICTAGVTLHLIHTYYPEICRARQPWCRKP